VVVEVAGGSGRTPYRVRLQPGPLGIDVLIEGYGLEEMEDGHGPVVHLDLSGDDPVVYVWPDINQGDRRIRVDLSQARESLRLLQPEGGS
jgi:hypothetical protein